MPFAIKMNGSAWRAINTSDELLQNEEFSDFPPVASSTEMQWGAIKLKRDSVKAGGVLVEGKWFHTDDASRIQLMALTMMGVGISANLQWKTMDGSFVHMTKALADQVVTGISINDQKVFDVAETHKSKMELSDDPASYDFSTGWPKIYGE